MRIPLSLIGTVSELLAHHQNPAIPPVLEGSSALTGNEPLIEVPPPGLVALLPRMSALGALQLLAANKIKAQVVMLDPWYRRKNGLGRASYLAEVIPLLDAASAVGKHVFVWGFPESVARLVDHWPENLKLASWLTWYFKNAPSRGKSWRPSQQACLHLHHRDAKFYPEHFYSEKHRALADANRLEYKMTPFSVLESGLLSGFIKRSEQTGYTAQKPESVIEPLLRMTMRAGDLVVDPTAGSGTTGAVAARLGLRAILADRAPGAHKVIRTRLGDSLAATELP